MSINLNTVSPAFKGTVKVTNYDKDEKLSTQKFRTSLEDDQKLRFEVRLATS